MIVLDTHALIWWVDGHIHLSEPAYTAITDTLASEDEAVLVSTISAWEIAMLVEKGRLDLTMDVDDWLATVAAIDGVRFCPVDVETAVASTRLPGAFHPDPADRIITALARHHNVPLVTADTKIQNYPHVRTLW